MNLIPGARRFNRYFLFGAVVQGPKRNVLIPSYVVPRDRSRYMPHQGKRERLRRRMGGFHKHQLAFPF